MSIQTELLGVHTPGRWYGGSECAVIVQRCQCHHHQQHQLVQQTVEARLQPPEETFRHPARSCYMWQQPANEVRAHWDSESRQLLPQSLENPQHTSNKQNSAHTHYCSKTQQQQITSARRFAMHLKAMLLQTQYPEGTHDMLDPNTVL